MLKYVCVLLLLLAPTMGQNVTIVPGNNTLAGRVTCDTASAEGWRGCTYYPNTDRDGKVVKKFKASSRDSCCRKCWSNSKCYTWVYVSLSRRCYFQDNTGLIFSRLGGFSTGFGYCAYDHV